ncbi:chemotaxis protein CheB [Mangrovibacterium marinum]|uniref:protein-glutamate methylesterase n=1 Tax=Mangrovibacterium marinum TaxID=1639118 RepID=A0A2T5C4K7_9BACT|nr:chemotaxis protein CheB [Mangrovibacterium marinum]PTN09789.1 two-component system chemotaxis response regulator CheB [Mangrovibacterium marinum]
MNYQAVVIGTSFGGLDALRTILPQLGESFPVPVIVVLHIGDRNIDSFISHLNGSCSLTVKEAEMNEPARPGFVYFAPPNYHLLIENNFCFSLSADEKLNFSRPSIDVLFESAAWVYKQALIGVILTGANSDGADGLKVVKQLGGTTLVQNPCTALAPVMPRFALTLARPDFRINLERVAPKLIELTSQ